MPPMNRIETNTATSDRFIDSRVKPTSLAPASAAASGVMPSSTWREMFSSTTMASSTTRPVATISAISDRLFSEKPQRYITAKLPTSATGTAATGIIAARQLRQEQQHDEDDQADGDEQRALRLVQRRADGRRAVARDVERHAGGQEGAQRRQLRRDAVDGRDDVGLRLAADHQQHRRLVVEVAGVVAVLDAVVRPWRRRTAAPARRCGRR